MSTASGTSDYFVSVSREAKAGRGTDGGDGNRSLRPPRANTGNPSFYPAAHLAIPGFQL